MGMPVNTPRTWRFGVFELDASSGELRRSGSVVKLQEQPARILLLLLANAGQTVTRDQLRQHLWLSDTFVDFDHGLNSAVMKLREALGDSADKPLYIETIPRKGYRFVAPVLEPPTGKSLLAPDASADPSSNGAIVPRAQDARLASMAGPSANEGPSANKLPSPGISVVEPDHGFLSRRWLKIAAGVLAISVVAVAAVVAYRWHRPQGPQEQAALTAVPFTALPGQATSPAFSPDGSRIAFAWNGDPAHGAKGFDLFVKALGSETLLRLTQHPSEWISPAWSPDGTQIAFHRLAGADTGIYVVPALGGPERKLRSTRMPGPNFTFINFSLISWSPDGKWIAFADVAPEDEHPRIHLLSTETLETRQIPISPMCIGEGLPAFSHNGEYLAYWCLRGGFGGFDAVLYSLPIPGNQPKTISSFRAYPNGLTWSADDEKLIYSLFPLGNGSSDELGEVTVENGSTKQLAFAGSAMLPTVAAKGNKLAYSSFFFNSGIWRRDLLQPESPAVELIPSSRPQFDAQYSPDGKRIAFGSLRSGLQGGVWISSDDGSNLVQISDPNYVGGSPQWSPDGNRIAFDSFRGEHWEIYVADVTERKPRKLVTNISDVTRPHWSRDGKWIYFRSNEPGRMGVYRCPASGGDAIALAKDTDAINPQESLDGKTVYFASNYERSTLKQVALPAQPGAESEVDGLPRLNNANLWTLSPSGIYFVSADAPRSLRYFDFLSKQIRPIFEADKDFSSGLSVSPDGHWILYSQAGDMTGDITLVDHFH
jgi:Tol biopolymer transport system component/DNA-binding winged helix-turn-helix (wHTH) protein